ncbi:hypothetical protein GCM10028799_62860 [Kribbella italica]
MHADISRLLQVRPDDSLPGEGADDIDGTSGARWVVDRSTGPAACAGSSARAVRRSPAIQVSDRTSLDRALIGPGFGDDPDRRPAFAEVEQSPRRIWSGSALVCCDDGLQVGRGFG